MSLSLWDWATRVYGRPGVEAACLDLQDQHGQCVSLILWALWATQDGFALSDAAMTRAVAIAKPWDQAGIRPLREARRGLKAGFTGFEDADREALLARVKDDELQAERLLLGALEAIDPVPNGLPIDALGVLLAISNAWGGPAPAISALKQLAGPFSGP
ncbi:MAG TPA: TIGR02444 family protein [Caulobacteraceae bacterium]